MHGLAAAALFALLVGSGAPRDEKVLLDAVRSPSELRNLVSREPQAARRLGDRLVREVLSGHSEGTLDQALAIALALEDRFSDPTLFRTVENLRRLPPEERAMLLDAYRALGRSQASFENGEFGDAEREATALVDRFKSLGESAGELKARNLVGNALWGMERIEEAGAAFRELRTLAEERQDPERLASALGNLANLDVDAGKIREAESAYRRVGQIGEVHGLPRARAFALLYIGNIYHQLRLAERAAPLYEEAQRLFARLGESGLEASAALNRGASLQRMGSTEEAIESYARALVLHGRTGNVRGKARALSNLAEILGDRGELDAAEAILEELVPIVSASKGPEMQFFHWGALLTQGDLERRRGEPERARASYESALSIVDSLGRGVEIAETRWRLARCLDPVRAQEELQSAVALLDTLRGRPASEEERQRFIASRRRVYEDLAAIHLRRSDPAAAFAVLEGFRSRAFLDLLTGGGEVDATAESSPRVVLAAAAKPEPLARAAEALPQGALVLYYTVAADWVALLALGREGILFSQIRDGGLDSLEPEALGHLLLDPVETLLRRQRMLFIVPDGVLFSAPWAALRWGSEKRLLVETHDVAVEPSVAALVTFLRRSGRRSSPALVVANRSLGEAQMESAELARLMPRSLLAAGGPESVVKREMARRSVVHFATHARLDSKQPLASSLVLEDEPRTIVAGLDPLGADDGLLTGFEVLTLRLEPGALVTLAACETAGDGVASGEGIAGLARAFFHAGAGTVVASLWPVDDRATRELMVRFYRELGRGKSRARALARAQASLAHGDAGERFREPLYWAGFILIGDPR